MTGFKKGEEKMFAQVSNVREMIVTVAASLFAAYLFVGSTIGATPIA